MELIDRRARVYAAPATLKAHEPEYDIVASYGPSPWNQQHDCTIGGVRITKTSIREGDHHVWCLFPDGRVMLVREDKIIAIKQSRKITGAPVYAKRAA